MTAVSKKLTRERHERSGNDFYIEPSWSVRALLEAERFSGKVWDPACGSGTIPKTCEAFDLDAVGSDIADRGYGGVQDFLAPEYEYVGVDNIICNPPFNLAEKFIARALSVTQFKVAMLLRLAFLEGQRRAILFRQTPLARVHVFAPRVSMPPGEMLLRGDVEPSGGSVAFAWFVWSADHQGPATLNWLDKPKEIE